VIGKQCTEVFVFEDTIADADISGAAGNRRPVTDRYADPSDAIDDGRSGSDARIRIDDASLDDRAFEPTVALSPKQTYGPTTAPGPISQSGPRTIGSRMTADSWIVADASVVAPLLPSTMPASNSSNETSSRSHGYVASVQSPSEMTPCTTASDAKFLDPVDQRLFAGMRVGGANRIENTGIEQIDARVETIRALVLGVFNDRRNLSVTKEDTTVLADIYVSKEAERRRRSGSSYARREHR